jgi:hypothetical protein
MTGDARNTRVASLTHWRRRSVMQLATPSWGRDVLFGVNTGPEYVIIRTTYVGLIVTSRGRVTTSTRIARQAKSEYNAFSAVVFLLPCEDCVVVEIETGCLSLTHWNLCAHRGFVLAVICLDSGLASAALSCAFGDFAPRIPSCTTSGASVSAVLHSDVRRRDREADSMCSSASCSCLNVAFLYTSIAGLYIASLHFKL